MFKKIIDRYIFKLKIAKIVIEKNHFYSTKKMNHF